MTEGQRNQNVYVLAMAFNDYGINQNLAEYILNQYESRNFDRSEIKRTIDSAYAQRQNFGTKYYEDEDKVNQIRHKLKRGVAKKDIRVQGTQKPCRWCDHLKRWSNCIMVRLCHEPAM